MLHRSARAAIALASLGVALAVTSVALGYAGSYGWQATPDAAAPSGLDGARFDGYFVSGFEVSLFSPGDACPPVGPDGQAYWLGEAPGAGFFDQVRAARDAAGLDNGRGQAVYRVSVEGMLSDPGHFGHLGAYPRLLTVTAVLSVASAQDCRP
jgi:hypothetical protein